MNLFLILDREFILLKRVDSSARRWAFACKEHKEANITARKSADPRGFSAGPREISSISPEFSAGVFGKLAQKNMFLRDSSRTYDSRILIIAIRIRGQLE